MTAAACRGAGGSDSLSTHVVARALSGLRAGRLSRGVVLMVDQSEMTGVLSEFASTLATDFPIHGILDHLVERIVAVLPVTSAGVTLISDGLALLRWTHPQRGVVSATAMVSAAEQSELIDQIGCWVLERSCEDHVGWAAAAPRASLDLAVNVSARQLMGPGFCTTVAAVLERTGMDPGRLVLEVTENILIEDTGRATTVLLGLRDLGLRIALDDFGTGYSSLSYLRHLPIDIVKIDRGFIADIGQAREGTAIVAAVTNLAHVLGLVVVAEGVETTDQHEQLRVIGCDFAQGFLFAHPMPAPEVLVLLSVPLAEPVTLPLPKKATAVVG